MRPRRRGRAARQAREVCDVFFVAELLAPFRSLPAFSIFKYSGILVQMEVVIGWVAATLNFVGECTLILSEAIRRFFRRPIEFKEWLAQMAFVGASSVPIVFITTFSSGAVIALYTSKVLIRYGAATLAGGTIGLAVVREIAPVLAGIMVAARCGSAMSAQIGTMKVTEQVDALKSLNIHPSSYLVIPRLVACMTMLPVLGLVGMYSGVFGGYTVSVLVNGIPDGSFWTSFRQFIEFRDIGGGLLKTLIFGLTIAIVACQQGLATEGGAEGVGKTTTRTVVISMLLIYVADYFLTSWLFIS
jgi:phospholipid/cholesterol/gamma-HCH transport system permease protein